MIQQNNVRILELANNLSINSSKANYSRNSNHPQESPSYSFNAFEWLYHKWTGYEMTMLAQYHFCIKWMKSKVLANKYTITVSNLKIMFNLQIICVCVLFTWNSRRLKPSPHYTKISVILFFNHVFPSLGEVRVILYHGINKNILFFFFNWIL